ncbi:hypothetical protein RHMOL_Rhmol08G0185900 [Rhododendron molle]|uniref:Uncharacterized protein n=1 Tax=Rhododendron molle TaxID=49168 RepID=A0ACC0MQ36_RHOML|nr:hypothetical protein RHMOL_Rhmol08G0185900 [Rhododendron molle]
MWVLKGSAGCAFVYKCELKRCDWLMISKWGSMGEILWGEGKSKRYRGDKGSVSLTFSAGVMSDLLWTRMGEVTFSPGKNVLLSQNQCSHPFFPEKLALSIIGNVRGIYRAPGPRSGPERRSYKTPTGVPSVPPGLG